MAADFSKYPVSWGFEYPGAFGVSVFEEYEYERIPAGNTKVNMDGD
jgi:hypothetical protein